MPLKASVESRKSSWAWETSAFRPVCSPRGWAPCSVMPHRLRLPRRPATPIPRRWISCSAITASRRALTIYRGHRQSRHAFAFPANPQRGLRGAGPRRGVPPVSRRRAFRLSSGPRKSSPSGASPSRSLIKKESSRSSTARRCCRGHGRLQYHHADRGRDSGKGPTRTWKDFSSRFAPPIGGAVPRGLGATVIGAGGAARAVVHALVGQGAPRARPQSNTREGPKACRRFRGSAGPLDASGCASHGEHSDLIVQTTSAGMAPQPDIDPLPWYEFTGREMVYDLVYAPPTTTFLAAGRGRRVQGDPGAPDAPGPGIRAVSDLHGARVPAGRQGLAG